VDELLEIQLETQVKLRSTNQKNKCMLDKELNLREQITKYTNNMKIMNFFNPYDLNFYQVHNLKCINFLYFTTYMLLINNYSFFFIYYQ
jgi:hypothetical protein